MSDEGEDTCKLKKSQKPLQKLKNSFSALIAQRSKRRKVEKKSASAFEKLRELKAGGSRNKWATEETSKIYDEVDEAEYTKIVSSRASDWIVDDGELKH